MLPVLPDPDSPADLLSPCRRHCTLNDAQVCIGCGRAIAEITGWMQADVAARRQILQLARQRLLALHPR